jgi:hypothetical protein
MSILGKDQPRNYVNRVNGKMAALSASVLKKKEKVKEEQKVSFRT